MSGIPIEVRCSLCQAVLPHKDTELRLDVVTIFIDPSDCKCNTQINCGSMFIDEDAVAEYCNELQKKIADLEARVYTCSNCGLRSNEYEAEPGPEPPHERSEIMTKETTAIQRIKNELQSLVDQPASFGKKLYQLMQDDPTLTTDQIAEILWLAPSFVRDRLQLHTLTEKIANMVDNKTLLVMDGYLLALLPSKEQEAFLDLAQTQLRSLEGPNYLLDAIRGRLKELKNQQKNI